MSTGIRWCSLNHEAIAALLLVHAIAHLAGFAWPWWLREPLPALPNDTAVLGDAAMRALSLDWLIVAIGFVIAALLALRAHRGWRQIASIAAFASLVLSVLCAPASIAGVPINLAILGWLRAANH